MGFGWFSKSGTTGDKALSKAGKFEEAERWAEALSYYDEVLEKDPASEPAALGSRRCRGRLVDFNLDEAEAFKATDPDKAREHATLAVELSGSDEGLKRRATEVLAAVSCDAQRSPAAPSSGRTPLLVSPCSCAAPCTSQAAASHEDPAIDVDDMAEFYLDSCEPAERAVYDRLGEVFRKGFVWLQQGELGLARPQLERAAREQPEQPGAHYSLGLLASLEGNTAWAMQCFERALQLDPNLGPALRHLAETHREAGDGPRAVELLKAWLTGHPHDAEAQLLMCLNLLEAGDAATGAAYAREAQSNAEEGDPRPYLLLARALRKTGDAAGATAELQALLARRPDQLEALIELGGLLLDRGAEGAERAAEVFKRCYRLDEERGWWYLIRVAEAYRARGWHAEARQVLDKAGDELPDDPEAKNLWAAASAAPRS